MARAELGVKRSCTDCGTKFYDLCRESAPCPSCGAIFRAHAPKAFQPRSKPVEEEALDVEDVDLIPLSTEVLDESGLEDDPVLDIEETDADLLEADAVGGDEVVAGLIDGGSLKEDEE